MFQVGLLMLPETELRPVSFNKRQQNEEALFQKQSWHALVSQMFPSFPCGKHCIQCLFLFLRYKLCLGYTAGNFNGNPSMRAVTKILRARANEDLSNFCEQFEQNPNFASTFKLDGTNRYPSCGLGTCDSVTCKTMDVWTGGARTRGAWTRGRGTQESGTWSRRTRGHGPRVRERGDSWHGDTGT